eukprot:497634-Prymnesium_polylepis.1
MGLEGFEWAYNRSAKGYPAKGGHVEGAVEVEAMQRACKIAAVAAVGELGVEHSSRRLLQCIRNSRHWMWATPVVTMRR